MMRQFAVVSMAVLVSASVRGQDLFVSSAETDSVKRYDWKTGEFKGDFVAPGAGGLDYPTAIAFGPGGDLFVGSGPGSQVLRYDGSTGAFKEVFIAPGVFQGGPSDMVFRDGTLYVSQWNNASPFNGGVLAFDAETGAFERQVITGITRSSSLEFDAQGRLYVSEFSRSDVTAYDPETGDEIAVYGGAGVLSGAMGIAFDAGGDLLASSWNQGSVKRFDVETGDVIETVVTGLANTGSHIVAPDGTLLVDDHNNGRILRYDLETGALLNEATIGGNLGPPEKFVIGPVPAPTSAAVLGFSLGLASMRRRRASSHQK